MTDRIFLLDPVKDLNGHHFNMALALLSASSRAGRDAVWLGHQSLDRTAVPDSIKFVPAFSTTIYQNQIGFLGQTMRKLLGERHFIRKMFPESSFDVALRRQKNWPLFDGDRLIELEAALQSESPDAGDGLAILSADPQTTEMVAVWASRLPLAAQPSIFVRTCWSNTDMPFGTYGGGYAKVAKRLHSVARHVVFSAETEAGVLEFETATGLKCNHCPPFVDPMAFENYQQPPSSDGSIVVGWLGDPRTEKGASLLPEIIETVCKSQDGKNIKFILQCEGKKKRWLREINSKLDTFSSVIEKLPSGASRSDYWKAFHRCNIILIPYSAEAYPPERGSMVAVEAMIAGKPIVSTPGTFAASMITEKTGVIASEAQSLAAGILEIARRFGVFETEARLRSKKALAVYDPSAIFKALTV